MAKKLTVLLLLFCNIAFAQIKPTPTQFDKFVNKSNIEWAAYASDTFNFDKADLNNILLARMYKNEIKGSLPVESRTADANFIRYHKMDSINYIFHNEGYTPYPIYDSLGNVIEEEQTLPKIDTSTFNVTEVTQILYVEKGKLKTYIPFITPMLPIFISSGTYIGERFYFNTCYNYKYCKKPRNKSKLVFLSQTKKTIPLNLAQPNEKLKEMYGKNLLESLWPQILAGKIDVFTVDGSKKIPIEALAGPLQYEETLLIPVYDSVGTIYKYQVEAAPVNPKKIRAVQLVQDWYYDTRKNKLSNIIKEAYIYAEIWTGNIKADEAVPVMKLVFK